MQEPEDESVKSQEKMRGVTKVSCFDLMSGNCQASCGSDGLSHNSPAHQESFVSNFHGAYSQLWEGSIVVVSIAPPCLCVLLGSIQRMSAWLASNPIILMAVMSSG
jgi:hypothetical protein